MSDIHSPFFFTDINLHKEVFTLTFQLYFKNFAEVSPALDHSFSLYNHIPQLIVLIT